MSGGGHPTVTVAIPGKLQFRGGGAWQSEPAGRSRIDPVLVRALKAAHRILGEAGLSPAAVPANGRFKHGGRTKELRSARALCRALATTAVITETQ